MIPDFRLCALTRARPYARPRALSLALRALTLSLCFVPAAELAPLQAQPQTQVPTMPQRVLAMDGPGGTVKLGDSVEQAKKAFPPPQGAAVMGATNYAIFGRDGWSWATEAPMQAFEVSLKDGKIVGILRTVSVAGQAGTKLIAQTTLRLGKPTAQSIGKHSSMYAWDAKPNARFLLHMKSGLFGSAPLMIMAIGDQGDLKMFNYRVDDVASTVKQMDMGAEALKRRDEKVPLPAQNGAKSGAKNGTQKSPVMIERKWLAEKLAKPSKAYPLAGFWKKGDCSNEWGLAIAPDKKGYYSISFCGPGGCFEPGTYRPNSKIVGDKAYKVINNNTLDVISQGVATRYVRCPSRAVRR